MSCQIEFTFDDLCQLEEKFRIASAELSNLSFSEESMKCDDKEKLQITQALVTLLPLLQYST